MKARGCHSKTDLQPPARILPSLQTQQGVFRHYGRYETDSVAPAAIPPQEYEEQVKKLEDKKRIIKERMLTNDNPYQKDFDTLFEPAFDFIKNPYQCWHAGYLDDKHMVQKLVFNTSLSYHRFEGFRTAATQQPFSLLEGLSNDKYGMVEPSGIEPLTSTLPVLRSPS